MVRFFRMSERGSFKRPTLTAIFAMIVCWSVALFLLREHPFIFILVAWPLIYALCAVLFMNPFRVTLGRAMHATRLPVIVAIPTKSDRLWLAANKPIFERTGLKVYQGEPIDNAIAQDDSPN